MSQSVIDVALLSFGGPAEFGEIPAFMQRLTGGTPSAELLAFVDEKYRAIGGGSPLNAITERQAAALEASLCGQLHAEVRVRPAYLHCEPTVAQVLGELDGADVLALSLSPYSSRLTTGAYRKALADAGASWVPVIEGWYSDPQFEQAVSERVAQALDGRQSSDYAVLFTAHSVPKETILEGDPYVEQIHEVIAHLLPAIMPGDWRLGWQSKGRRGGEWLEPSVEDVVLQLAAQGWQKLLVVPVGFIADNVETLYDLDIVLKRVVHENGMNYLRSEPPNDSPRFIAVLADAVIGYLAHRPVEEAGNNTPAAVERRGRVAAIGAGDAAPNGAGPNDAEPDSAGPNDAGPDDAGPAVAR